MRRPKPHRPVSFTSGERERFMPHADSTRGMPKASSLTLRGEHMISSSTSDVAPATHFAILTNSCATRSVSVRLAV